MHRLKLNAVSRSRCFFDEFLQIQESLVGVASRKCPSLHVIIHGIALLDWGGGVYLSGIEEGSPKICEGLASTTVFQTAAEQNLLPRLKLGELLILTTTKFVETCFVSWCICASMNLA
jgi:hypothetical protein